MCWATLVLHLLRPHAQLGVGIVLLVGQELIRAFLGDVAGQGARPVLRRLNVMGRGGHLVDILHRFIRLDLRVIVIDLGHLVILARDFLERTALVRD